MSLYVEIVECTSVAKSVIWTQSIYFQSMRFFAEDQIVGGKPPEESKTWRWQQYNSGRDDKCDNVSGFGLLFLKFVNLSTCFLSLCVPTEQ